MSPTELLILEKGRIPAWILLSEIDSYLREADETTDGEVGPVRVLAERVELPVDTVVTWVGQKRPQSFSFDTVDLFFCAMDRVHLWRGPYADYYEKVNLAYTKPEHCQHGVPRKEGERSVDVCNTCRVRSERTSAYRREQRAKLKCKAGHDMTAENTKTRRDGRIECRECVREQARACYARKMGRAA